MALRRTIGISAIPGEKPGEKTGLSACNVIAVTREMLDTVVSITTQRQGRIAVLETLEDLIKPLRHNIKV